MGDFARNETTAATARLAAPAADGTSGPALTDPPSTGDEE